MTMLNRHVKTAMAAFAVCAAALVTLPNVNAAELLERAVLQAETFAPGPTSGQFTSGGNGIPTPVINDNNFPFSSGRQFGVADNNEFIVIHTAPLLPQDKDCRDERNDDGRGDRHDNHGWNGGDDQGHGNDCRRPFDLATE